MPEVQVNNTNLPPAQTPPPDPDRRSSVVLPIIIVVIVMALLLIWFIFARADRSQADVTLEVPGIETKDVEVKTPDIEVKTPEVDVKVPDKVDVDVSTSKPADPPQ